MTAAAVMLPKEHGAWGQMALPLLTVTAVAGPSFVSAAVVAGFLAHEPLLVRLGARGTRARREHGSRATRWLAVLVALGVTAGVLGVARIAPDLQWTVLLPLVPVGAVVAGLWRNQPKSALSELAAAAAFPLAAVPAAASAGAPLAAGLAVALPFVVIFVVATVAVRSVTRPVGRIGPSAAAWTRARVVALALTGGAALFVAADLTSLPWAAAFAALPGLAVAAGIALAPPHPRHLKRVGWLLVGASFAASLVVVSGGL